MTLVYPVVHHLDQITTNDQVRLAIEAGANGVFLIDHQQRNNELAQVVLSVQDIVPVGFKVGVNFLGWGSISAYDVAMHVSADMLWLDAPGIQHGHLTPSGHRLHGHTKNFMDDGPDIFASVAFKYQPVDEDPVRSADAARAVDWVPVTSGAGTGQAPSIEKILEMSEWGMNPLGVASGMNLGNVREFAPRLSHILVATGVSKDEHHFDFERLAAFVGAVRS